MQYQLNSPEEKEEFAKQMVDYMAKNKIKSPKTETYDELYYKLLNDLKSKKNIKKINIQGMDGFKYTPVNKKAALGDSIKEGWKAFKDYSRENQWVQPTLQGAAGAGIGALTGLLMGPKRRAMKLLISTLGGAGIGVGTGFATNYALKKEKQKADEKQRLYKQKVERDQEIKQMLQKQIDRDTPEAIELADKFINKYKTHDDQRHVAFQDEWNNNKWRNQIGVRPSDEFLYQVMRQLDNKRQLADTVTVRGKNAYPGKGLTMIYLENAVNDMKRKLLGQDRDYLVRHLDTPADLKWRLNHLNKTKDTIDTNAFVRNAYKNGTWYLLDWEKPTITGKGHAQNYRNRALVF